MGRLEEGAVRSETAEEREIARRQRVQQILDRLGSGPPFAYLLGETYINAAGITPEQALERYNLVSGLLTRIESGADVPDFDALFDDGRYDFLTEPYGRAGVTGWGALRTLLDRKRFGEN